MGRIIGTGGLVVLVVLLGGCWPQPGFDAGRTHYNPHESTITSDNVEGLREVWSVRIGERSVNAPIARDGVVYVTSDAGDGTVAAVDAGDGDIRWMEDGLLEDALTEPSLTAPVYHDDELLAGGTLKSPGSGSGTGHVLRIDPETGDVNGTFGADPSEDMATARGEPAVHYVNGDIDGGAAWIAWDAFPRHPAAPVALGDPPPGRFAIVSGWSVDRVVWSQGTEALGYTQDCPAVSHAPELCLPDWSTDLGATPGQPVAVGSDKVAIPAGRSMHVLDVRTGEVLWTCTATGPIAYAGDVQPLGFGDPEPALFAVHNGEGLISPHVKVFLFESGPRCDSPTFPLPGPATGLSIGGDVVYVTTSGGYILAYPRDGCPDSQCDPLTWIETEHSFTGSPIVSDGRVISTTEDGHIVAFGLDPT